MRFFFASLLLSFCLIASAQNKKTAPLKYPSLLWEISGNGLKKPSYLFGTMHVSSKMAFHLSDSFYLAIKNADVVALETNPENWQKDMSKYDFNTNFFPNASNKYDAIPNDYLNKQTLQFTSYQKTLERALYSNPAIINNLLYRSNSEFESEFEENTFLDMYIFQVGKRWGKKVTGVEDFDESMRLVMEAYADSYKDKNTKRNIEVEEDYSYTKLQDAYRAGNLDLIDTINLLNTVSPAFNEKFLFKRNDNQAEAIDSIIKSKASLFVGVGAAHLPGERGVIEILRRMGYKLRPIKMLERDSRFKDEIEKTFVPVKLKTVTATDGFYSVSIPGEFYTNENPAQDFEQRQFADMANGSYYMITRVPTTATLFGHTTTDVFKQVDSVLYENIPGKIVTKKVIEQNGFKGFDISNRTRRGDYQRYKIFITPFEVLIFKMSGHDEYVKNSAEAEKFFSSIQLKEKAPDWKKFSPSFGGFEAELPSEPYVFNNNQWQFNSHDSKTGSTFIIIKNNLHNYGFIEEDSFDLGLMEESFASSDFIEKSLSKKVYSKWGVPMLDAEYKHKDGTSSKVRHLIKGPHYYTLINHSKTGNNDADRFFNSFAIKPFVYNDKKKIEDRELKFSAYGYVTEEQNEALKNSLKSLFENVGVLDEATAKDKGEYKDKLFVNDSTGERIYVSYYKSPKYYFDDDSTKLGVFKTDDDQWTIKDKKLQTLTDNNKIWEYKLTDNNSSRIVYNKVYYTNGIGHALTVLTDTSAEQSKFIQEFFTSFKPADTVKGFDPFTKKTKLFFSDFYSADTALRKLAINNVDILNIEGEDLSEVKKGIQSLNWNEKRYLETKQNFINLLGTLTTKEASDYLKQLYYQTADTIELQDVILQNLLQQKTQYAFNTFRDIVVNEPPILSLSQNDYENEEHFLFEQLSDSLELTATIFKDILPLINLDDYELPIMNLTGQLVDEKLILAKDYEVYLPKFLIEAKQLWKKQLINEKSKSIAKAQKTDDEEEIYTRGREVDNGNDMLSLYAKLLMPFWKSNTNVSNFINQLLLSNDQRLKYNTAILMIDNGRSIPDSTIQQFAASDEYRYELYYDLNTLGKLSLFPSKYLNQKDIAKSKLIYLNTYNKPDTLVYLQKLPVAHGGKNGFVYFFKYKENKNSNTWKIASIGMLPQNEKEFAITKKYDKNFDFNKLTQEKFQEGENLDEQLQKVLKKLIYSKRKSAQKFYDDQQNMAMDYGY